MAMNHAAVGDYPRAIAFFNKIVDGSVKALLEPDGTLGPPVWAGAEGEHRFLVRQKALLWRPYLGPYLDPPLSLKA